MDIKRIWAPPVFEDEEKNWTAKILHITVLVGIAVLAAVIIISLIQSGFVFDNSRIVYKILLPLLLPILMIMRWGYVRVASLTLVTVLWVILTLQAWSAGGIRDAAFIAYIIVILFANLLLGWKAGLAFAGLVILSGWSLAHAETIGVIPVVIDDAYTDALDTTVIFGLAGVILAVTTAGLSNALQRARRSEQRLNQSNQELTALSTSLEQQVETRTHRLETLTAINERLSAILQLDELLREVVDQVQQNFNYYHVHIFLLDPDQAKLVVAAGTGEAGAQMEASGHSIGLDAPTSLVARAARTGEVVSVDNVREAEDWLPNPLLPDTCSEMAVPVVLQGQVVGVLDVQEDKIAGLDEGDAGLLRSLANQVAVAVRNARLFEEVESALAEARAVQARYVEQSWQQVRIGPESGQYHYARTDAPGLDESTRLKIKGLALKQPGPAVVTTVGQESGLEQTRATDESEIQPSQAIVAPIKLRETAIGSLQLHPLHTGQGWNEDDLTVVEAVVDELARTAENLRLVEETRQRANYERLVGDITGKIRQAPNLGVLTRVVAEELGKALNVSHSLVKVGAGVGSTSAPSSNGKNGNGPEQAAPGPAGEPRS